MGDKGLKRMIKAVGEDLVLDLIDLMLADLHCTRDDRDDSFLFKRKERIKELLGEKAVIDKSGLDINGRDLIKLGYKEGRKIGEILDYLTDLVIEKDQINTKEKLFEIVKNKYSEEK